MVFSLPVTVTIPNYKWLLTNIRCRGDRELIKQVGEQKMFYTGGNSSCRAHIWQHYELYKQCCKDKDIHENHHVLPHQLWKQLEEIKHNPKAKSQAKLDGAFEMVDQPLHIMWEGVIEAVGKFVACDDQVSVQSISTKHWYWPRSLGAGRGKQGDISQLPRGDEAKGQNCGFA